MLLMDSMFQSVDWAHVTTGVVALIAGVILRTLFDLQLARVLVQYLSFIPTRWLFRHREHGLAGQWEHTWDSGGSVQFGDVRDRHSHPKIRQFGSYCYAEFLSKGKWYYFFGKISGDHMVGDWADLRDTSGYFGAFQLRIVDADNLRGVWMGHSKTSVDIRSDNSTWKRIK